MLKEIWRPVQEELLGKLVETRGMNRVGDAFMLIQTIFYICIHIIRNLTFLMACHWAEY